MTETQLRRTLIPITLFCSFLFAFADLLVCQKLDTLPIHTRRISDRVLVVWPGDYAQTTNMIAIASERGIVVVDTESSWSVTERIRDLIAREFGRDDFAYLVNTHGHADHGGGNQVFRDTEIIAHDRSRRLLQDALGPGNLNGRRDRLGYWLSGLTRQLDQHRNLVRPLTSMRRGILTV